MKLSLISVALALFGTSQVNTLRVERGQHKSVCAGYGKKCWP